MASHENLDGVALGDWVSIEQIIHFIIVLLQISQCLSIVRVVAVNEQVHIDVQLSIFLRFGQFVLCVPSCHVMDADVVSCVVDWNLVFQFFIHSSLLLVRIQLVPFQIVADE